MELQKRHQGGSYVYSGHASTRRYSHYDRAGRWSICVERRSHYVGWVLETQRQVHTSGDVPKYKEKLQTGMEKFFIRQTCDKPVVRNNYFIQTDGNLPWSKSIGDEDKDVVGWYTAEPAKDINQLYFRSERQSLRRLPKTGATIFTIRTYFLPITELAQEPYVPRRLLNGIRSWVPEVQDYRGYTKFKDVVEPYLEKMADEQEAKGYTVETEPEVYPY